MIYKITNEDLELYRSNGYNICFICGHYELKAKEGERGVNRVVECLKCNSVWNELTKTVLLRYKNEFETHKEQDNSDLALAVILSFIVIPVLFILFPYILDFYKELL